jgi:hypothetical protein
MNKITTSKDDGIGVVRQSVDFTKSVDPRSGSSLNIPKCSYESDNVTTYVLKSVWSTALNNFIFPPYVECEYVD